ncbi:MAG: response regulator [Candidatus Wallbacteria bacterium]|nr:response regulator [Candidatus Wallbacteria bacterium]
MLNEIKILLIEDNQNDTRLIRVMLEEHCPSYRLDCSPDLATGLKDLSQGGYDVILLDLNLPDCVGIETLYKVQAEFREIPIIVLTCMDTQELAIEALKNYAQDYLIKGKIEYLDRAISNAIERKRIERKLSDSEKKYRELVENLNEGIWSVDGGLRTFFVNRRILELLDYSQQEMCSQHFCDFLADEDRDFFRNREFLKTDCPKILKLTLIKKDLSEIPVKAGISPLKNEKGEFEGFIACVTDESQITTLEEEKKSLRNQLFQSQKLEAIGTLAGGVAHDFNNSLMVIQCNASLLKHSKNPARDLPEYLGEIESACFKAAELTRQLLIFSRNHPMREEAVDLNSMLRNLLKMLSRLIGENIKLKMLLCQHAVAFKGDRFQIEQAILNLIVNARDAMPDGGNLLIQTEKVQFSIADSLRNGLPVPGEYGILTVSDTGAGIPEEIIDRIFDPFFSTKTEGKGTGLGLSVVYGIVVKHKGYIRVKSQMGSGTTFKMFLPLVKPDSIKTRKKIQGKIKPGNGERILLIEDDQNILKVFSKLLNLNGYQVKTASSLTEAEALFQNEFSDFKLLISDMILGDGNGLEMAKRFTEQNHDLKVIFISGYFDQKKIKLKEIKDRGFWFIQKPCDTEILLKTVKEALEPSS